MCFAWRTAFWQPRGAVVRRVFAGAAVLALLLLAPDDAVLDVDVPGAVAGAVDATGCARPCPRSTWCASRLPSRDSRHPVPSRAAAAASSSTRVAFFRERRQRGCRRLQEVAAARDGRRVRHDFVWPAAGRTAGHARRSGPPSIRTETAMPATGVPAQWAGLIDGGGRRRWVACSNA